MQKENSNQFDQALEKQQNSLKYESDGLNQKGNDYLVENNKNDLVSKTKQIIKYEEIKSLEKQSEILKISPKKKSPQHLSFQIPQNQFILEGQSSNEFKKVKSQANNKFLINQTFGELSIKNATNNLEQSANPALKHDQFSLIESNHAEADANMVKQFSQDHQIQENQLGQTIQPLSINQKIFSDYLIGSSGQIEQNSAHFFNENSQIQIIKIDNENINSSKGEDVKFQIKEFEFQDESKSEIMIPQNFKDQFDDLKDKGQQVQIQAKVIYDPTNQFQKDQKQYIQNKKQEDKSNLKVQRGQNLISIKESKKKLSLEIGQEIQNQNDSFISQEEQIILQSIEDQFNKNKLDKDQCPSSVESKSYEIVRSQEQKKNLSETILEQNIPIKIQCKTSGNHLRSQQFPMGGVAQNIKKEIYPQSANFIQARSQPLEHIKYFSASSSNVTDEINQTNQQLQKNLHKKKAIINKDQVNLTNLNNIRDGSNFDASLEPMSSSSQQIMYLTSITHQMIKIVKQLIENDKQQDQTQLQDLLSLAKTAEKLSRKISSQGLTFSNSIQPNNREEIQILQDQNDFLRLENKNLNKKLKSQEIFISMIIHDLRNPTNAVISMSDQIYTELEDELLKGQKIKEIFSNMELEAASVIQKAIELSSLSQLSLMQELQAINQILNGSSQENKKNTSSNSENLIFSAVNNNSQIRSDNFKGFLANPDSQISYSPIRNITFYNQEVKPGNFSEVANLERGDHLSQGHSDQFQNSVKFIQFQSNRSESSAQSSNQLGVKKIVKSPHISNFPLSKLSLNNQEQNSNSKYSQFAPINEQDELQERSADISLDINLIDQNIQKNKDSNKPDLKSLAKIQEEPIDARQDMNSSKQLIQIAQNNISRLSSENLQIPNIRSSLSLNNFKLPQFSYQNLQQSEQFFGKLNMQNQNDLLSLVPNNQNMSYEKLDFLSQNNQQIFQSNQINNFYPDLQQVQSRNYKKNNIEQPQPQIQQIGQIQQNFVSQPPLQEREQLISRVQKFPIQSSQTEQIVQIQQNNPIQSSQQPIQQINQVQQNFPMQSLQIQQIDSIQQNPQQHFILENLRKKKQQQQIAPMINDEQFNISEADCDEFPSSGSQFKRPSQRLQRDFISHTNNLNKKINAQSQQAVIQIIQNKMQKYIKNDLTQEIIENPDYNSLYELISVSDNQVVILEKQYIFTGSFSSIPLNQQIQAQFAISRRLDNILQQQQRQINLQSNQNLKQIQQRQQHEINSQLVLNSRDSLNNQFIGQNNFSVQLPVQQQRIQQSLNLSVQNNYQGRIQINNNQVQIISQNNDQPNFQINNSQQINLFNPPLLQNNNQNQISQNFNQPQVNQLNSQNIPYSQVNQLQSPVHIQNLIPIPQYQIQISQQEEVQIRDSIRDVNSDIIKKEDENAYQLASLVKDKSHESQKIEQEKYQSAKRFHEIQLLAQSEPNNQTLKLFEPQKIDNLGSNSIFKSSFPKIQESKDNNQINSKQDINNIFQIQQPKNHLPLEVRNFNEKNVYQIANDFQKQNDSGSSISRYIQQPENNKILNLNSDLSDSKISKQFFPINRTNGIQEPNIHFQTIQGQSLSSNKTVGRNPITSSGLNNQTPINADDRASLESIAQQAQLLIQLNNNSKAENMLALQELSQIQISLQSYLLSNDKIKKIQKLSQGLGYQAKMLLNLINDLLDYAKFENGKFSFYNEIFDLGNLIKDNTFQTISYSALEKQIDLEFTAQLELIDGPIVDEYDFTNIQNSKKEDEDQIQESFNKKIQIQESQEIIEKLFLQKVFGDEKRYLQVLLNFLSNAVKFTQNKGLVKVNVKITKIDFQNKQQQLPQDQFQQKSDLSNFTEKKVSDQSLQQNLPNILHLIAHPKMEKNISQNENFQLKKTPSSNNSGVKTAKLSSINKSLRKNSSINDFSKPMEIQQDDFHGERSKSRSRSIIFQNILPGDMLNENQDENNINQQINKINDQVLGQNFSQEEDELNYKTANVIFVIEIIDSGIGVRQENINQLFMEFGMLEESSQMNRQGTGLGLTISKKIVKQMGGDITVKSIYGKGTTFFIEIKTKVKIPKQDLFKFEKLDIIKRQKVIKSGLQSSFDLQLSSLVNSNNELQLSKNIIESSFQSIKDLEANQNFFEQQQEINQISQNNKAQNQENIHALSASSYSEQFLKREEQGKPIISIYKEKNQKIRQQRQLLEEMLKESLKKNLQNLKNQSDQFNSFEGLSVIRREDKSPEFRQAQLPLNISQDSKFANSGAHYSFRQNQKPMVGKSASQIQKQYFNPDIKKDVLISVDIMRESQQMPNKKNEFIKQESYQQIESQQNNQLKLNNQVLQSPKQYQSQEMNKNQQKIQNNRRFSVIQQTPQNLILRKSSNQNPFFDSGDIESQVNKGHVSFGLESANVTNKVPNSFTNFQEFSQVSSFSKLGDLSSQKLTEQTQKKSLMSEKIMELGQSQKKEDILQDFSLENNFSRNQKEYSVTPKFRKEPKIQENEIILPIKSRSSLSPTFFYSPNDKEKPSELQKNELKCLVANDEPFQLKMMTIPLKKMNFKISKAENGFSAFLKVRKFIEDYNKVRQVLLKPGSSTKNLNNEQLQIIQSSLKNFDVIILDLNMPIMNGFQACERILEVYKSFNSLPDYEDLMGNNPEDLKKIEKLKKLFEDIELNKEIRLDEDSEELFSLKMDSAKSKESSLKSLQDMIQELSTFYEFKRHFKGMLRVKPFMVACSADINERICKQASDVGFDKVIQAPLSEQKIKDNIMPELERKFKMGNNIRMYSRKQNQKNNNVNSQGNRLTKKFSQVQFNLFKSSSNIQQSDVVEIDKFSV